MILPGQQMTAARKKVYPRHSPGRFRRLRNVFSVLLQALLFSLPWLQWHSRQAVLADLPGRKLYLFGLVLHPQDNYFLLLITILAVLLLSGVSTLAGRMWCGFACPQTIFTQAFIAVERFYEGDRAARIRLDKAAWNGKKLRAKLAKWATWTGMGTWLGITFAGYFLPIRELMGQLLSGRVDSTTALVVLFFTGVSLFDFGYFREQFCQHICPYARLQSTMLDADSIIVGYDSRRGEPRAPLKRAGRGACLDCSLCVQVCPAGIDIRDGLQSECIGCTACIDACDSIMDQMNYPRGLIRYSTENLVEKKPGKILRGRLLGYGSVLAILVIAFGWRLLDRVPVEFDVLRERTALFRETWDGKIENVYTLKIQNKTQDLHTYDVQLDGMNNASLDVPHDIKAKAGELVTVSAVITADPKDITSPNIRINLKVIANDDPAIVSVSESRFISPTPKR